MATVKCCKCGTASLFPCYHHKLKDGKYICSDCDYKIRKKKSEQDAVFILFFT